MTVLLATALTEKNVKALNNKDLLEVYVETCEKYDIHDKAICNLCKEAHEEILKRMEGKKR